MRIGPEDETRHNVLVKYHQMVKRSLKTLQEIVRLVPLHPSRNRSCRPVFFFTGELRRSSAKATAQAELLLVRTI